MKLKTHMYTQTHTHTLTHGKLTIYFNPCIWFLLCRFFALHKVIQSLLISELGLYIKAVKEDRSLIYNTYDNIKLIQHTPHYCMLAGQLIPPFTSFSSAGEKGRHR